MASYFLSDIHLKPQGDRRLEVLCGYLERLTKQIEPPHKVFFMGDIFDFWMGGHRIWVNRYQPFVNAVEKLKKSGAELYFFEGNHDIHIHPFWKDFGVKIVTEPLIMNLYGLKVRLEHGDLFNPDDKGYIFLRNFLRSAPLKYSSINAPGKLVAAIADWGTAASHKRTSVQGRKPEVIEDIKRRTRLYFEKCAMNSDFDLLIMGHTHIREDYQIEVKNRMVRYINLGSWFEDSPKVLIMRPSEISFENVTI